MKQHSHKDRRPGGGTAWVGTLLTLLAWRASPPVAGIALLALVAWIIVAWWIDRR